MSLFEKIANTKPPTLSDSIFPQIANANVATTKTTTPAVIKNGGGIGGIFKKFFEPEPGGKLRFRDVLREIPGEEVRHAKKAPEFGRQVFQGTARSGASVGLTLSNTINRILKTGKPEAELEAPQEVRDFSDAFHLVLFGDEDVEALGTRAERFPSRVSGFGEAVGVDIDPESKISKAFAFPAVLGLTALDFTGGGGQKRVAQTIAKMDKTEDIVNVLKNQIKGLTDDIIPKLADDLKTVSKPEDVEQALRVAITDVKTTKNFADKRMSSAMDERSFITSIKQSPETSPEVARKVASNYNPLSNDETLATARDIINKDLTEATRFVKDTSVPATAESNAVAQLLVRQAQNANRWDEAIDIVQVTAERATTQGQSIQALSMWNRLSPEGVLRYTQKVITDANKALPGKKQIKLTDDVAKDIAKRAQKIEKMVDGEEKAFETAKMLAKINEQVPSSFGRKLATAQILAQLLNPKTLIRNLGGNTAFSVLENVTDAFSVALDSPLSILTGTRSKAFPSITTQLKGFKEGMRLGVRDALHGVDTAGLPTKFDIPKTPVFKGRVGNSAEKLLNIVLRGPDRAAYKAAYDNSLYTQMKAAAKGRKGIEILEPTNEMKEIAHYDGLYRTFQDENTISNFFVGLKRTLNLNKDFGLGDILIKYPRTPGNLLARGLDYSPAGFVNAMYQAARPLMGRTFNQRAFIESFSRAIVGTSGLVGTGALMHRLGIITGERGKDPDIEGVKRVTGLGQYKVNASALKRFVLSGMDPEAAKIQKGDTLYTYDWFQPLAIGISIGANIDETHQNNETTKEKTLGLAGTLIESVASGVNTLGEQPLVQNLTRVLKFGGTISDVILNTAKQVPSSFVPTLLSQINQFVDNRSRNVYDPDIVREAYNAAKQRVPVFSGSLPPRISVFGEDLENYQNSSNNIFNVFFNPSFKSTYTPTPEADLVLSLFEEIGETKQAPRVVQKTTTVNGERIKLGPKQITAMQRFVGTVSRDYFHQLANSEEFKAQSPEDQVKFMSNVLTDIGSAAKILLLGNRPKKNPSLRTQLIIRNYLQGNQVLQEKIQEDIK